MRARDDEQDLARRQHRGQAAGQRLARHVVLAAPVARVAAEARRRQRHEARGASRSIGGSLKPRWPFGPRPSTARSKPPPAATAGVVVAARDRRGQSAVEPDGALLGDVEGLGERAHHPAVERAVVTLRDARVRVELRDAHLRGVELAAPVPLGQLAVGAHRRVAGREQQQRIGLAAQRRGDRIGRGLAQRRVIVDDDGAHRRVEPGAQRS